jgi:cytochrome c-type biogenesis protein CcmH
MTDSITTLREQLRQLQQLHEAGALDAPQYTSAKAGLERKLLDLVLSGAPDPRPVTEMAAAPAEPAAPVPRAGVGLWLGLGLAVLVVAGAGYATLGSPGGVGQAPADFTADAATPAEGAASGASAISAQQIEAMVAKLAARMKEQPGDPEGWAMLGRSYMALGRHDDALGAYQKALKLRPADANLLSDLADATAVKNGRSLDGEPTLLLDRALKIEPDNLKALALAGTAAFNRGDFVTAVKHWDRAVKVGPADNPMVEMSRGGAVEARERGKLPPAVASAELFAPAAPAAPAPAGAAGSDVTGTVRLSAALKAKAAPDDTVFIFARPAEGSRMPLAIVRKQVKDLPYEFKLDDTLAMSPAARISAAGRVVVGARISKSGQAMPQPGDLEGLSPSVAVGSRGVVVEIAKALP